MDAKTEAAAIAIAANLKLKNAAEKLKKVHEIMKTIPMTVSASGLTNTTLSIGVPIGTTLPSISTLLRLQERERERQVTVLENKIARLSSTVDELTTKIKELSKTLLNTGLLVPLE